MSTVVPLELADGSGGLNTRDPISGIRKNQFHRLENYLTDEGAYLKKRGGQELIQYAPIDPQIFVADSETLALYHLDEAAANDSAVDSSGNGYDMIVAPVGPTPGLGLFPIATPLGRVGAMPGPLSNDGRALFRSGSIGLDGLGALTMEFWVYINPSMNGKPIIVNRNNTDFTVSQSGAVLFGTQATVGIGQFVSAFENGFRIYRDWDSVNNKNASDPYIKFRILTDGVTGTATEITSKYLPTSHWLHVKGTYDSTTGEMNLYVNGLLHATATPNGGGNIQDSEVGIRAFGMPVAQYAMSSYLVSSPDVSLDEMRVSNVVRSGFPFKEPRGNPMILEKADGTKQAVVAADSGLYYTVGDGNWHLIIETDPSGSGALSPTARWDGVMIEDRLYMTNGVNTPLTWDGLRVVPTGEGVTPLTLSLSTSSSGNSNGIHGYAYAYKYGNDITGLSPIAYITVAGNADVNIQQLPTRHDNCDTIQIYKTKAGGTRFFLDREVANDPNVDFINLSGPYISGGAPDADSGADGVADGSTDTNLADDADYHEISAAVLATAIKKNRFYLPEHNRLFGCGSFDFPYDLSWGALGNPDVFLATAFVSVSGDKGPLIGMATSHGEIVLSKNANATSVLRGTDESNWTLTENIHPKVGSRDHWSFVHRYPVAGNGPYVLCFVATDGIYAHMGNDIVELSDEIGPTFQGMAVNTSSKEDWITSTQAEFQGSASNGGAATVNVQQSRYEQDGLREFAGDVRIVNQLDYIGLWPGNDVLVPGKVLFICPVKVADVLTQESFLFATDANRNLYLTTDNFATASIVTDLDAVTGTPILVSEDHRIIEIIYANTGGKDQYFILTSAADESGTVCRWNHTDALWENSATAFNTGLFWQADVEWKRDSSNFNDLYNFGTSFPNSAPKGRDALIGNLQIKRFFTDGTFNIGQQSNNPNMYLNHAQKMLIIPTFASAPNALGIWSEAGLSNNAGNIYTALVDSQQVFQNSYIGPTIVNQTGEVAAASTTFSVTAGFFGVGSWVRTDATQGFELKNPTFTAYYTTRETAFWRGGTFRPQAFWDGTRFWFVASGAEDGNNNRTCAIYRGTANGPFAVVHTPTTKSCIAMVSDGTNVWWTEQSSIDGGFSLFVKKSALGTFAAVSVGTSTANYLPTRLSWNANTSRLVAIGKNWSSKDSYNYAGFIGSLSTVNGALVVLKAFTSAVPGVGAIPVEITYQTTTPFAHFVAMRNQQIQPALELTTIYKVAAASGVAADVSTFKLDAYEGTDATDPTSGIQSNLLFMAASGVLGNYLWADRLYWYAPSTLAVDGRMLQLGVPGTWTVQGGLTSRTNELGDFNAFGNLTVDYSGTVEFFIRNASSVAALAASEREVTPNQPIQGFNPVTSFVQWRLLLIWDYTVAIPTSTPIVSVVNVGYFLGVSTVPPVVAEHWEGRTYFAMAEAGQLENNILIVFDKKNAFTTYRDWRIKGMKKFRNFLTALQDYELVKLEVGDTDLGNIINGLARTGALAQGSIVALDDAEANVSATINEAFPGKSGFVKITTYKGDDVGSFPRMLELPESATGEMRRVHAEPLEDFGWDWAQVWSLEIKTSDETEGDFVPSPNQQECIQKLDLKLLSTPVGREYTGK